jgi:hypothetical protein
MGPSKMMCNIRAGNPLIVFLLCMILGLVIIAPNADGENTPKQTATQSSWRNNRTTVLGQPGTKGTIEQPLPRGPGQVGADNAVSEVSLSWTQCQMHRSGLDKEQLEIYLDGAISSTKPVNWGLSSASPKPGGLPKLYFVEAASARPRPDNGDISLQWEISLDGAPFKPMATQPDNSLSVTFPSGSHTFKVRITGLPQRQQADGYYQLVLSQNLIPLL